MSFLIILVRQMAIAGAIDNVFTVLRTEAMENVNGFLGLSEVRIHGLPNKPVHFLKETIIIVSLQ